MRGVAFQHAAAVLACIDALSDSSVASVTVEGGEDIIDFCAYGSSGQIIWVRQLKSRVEGSTWKKSEIVKLVKLWSSSELAGKVPFEFATDGDLSRDMAKIFATDEIKEHPEKVAKALGLSAAELAKVRFVTRMGSASDLLLKAEHHLWAASPIGLAQEQVQSRVNNLLAKILLASGEEAIAHRTFSIDELSADLGLLSAYQTAQTTFEDADLVSRDDLLDAVIGQLRLGEEQAGRLSLWGHSGTGKSKLADQLHHRLVDQGCVVRMIEFDSADDRATALIRATHLLTGRLPVDSATDALLREVQSATAPIDVLICDNVVPVELCQLLLSCVAARTALVVTRLDEAVPGPFVPIEIGPFAQQDVESSLSRLLPTQDVFDLVDAIHGWPLLLGLVIASIRLQQAATIEASAIVSRLQVALKRDSDDEIWQKVDSVISLSLRQLGQATEARVQALGCLLSSLPMPVELLEALWECDRDDVKLELARACSIAVVKTDYRTFSVHEALRLPLRRMLGAEHRTNVEARLAAAGLSAGVARTREYFSEYLPAHLVESGDSDRAIALLVDRDWCLRVSNELGAPSFLSRQALDILRLGREVLSPSELLACWLLYRLYGEQLVMDSRLVPLFAAVHGSQLTESALQAGGASYEATIGMARLSATLAEQGKLEDADRIARLALRSAQNVVDGGSAEAIAVVLQTVLRSNPHWTGPAIEILESSFQRERDSEQVIWERAVAASTLLPINMEAARQVAEPIISQLRVHLGTEEDIEQLLGSDSDMVARHLLPVVAATDYDLASLLADNLKEFIRFEPEDIEAQVVAGALCGDTVAGNEIQFDLLIRSDVVSAYDLVLRLAKQGKQALAGEVIARVTSRRLQVRLRAAVGRALFESGESGDVVGEWFSQAVGRSMESPPGEYALQCGEVARELRSYDPDWAVALLKDGLENAEHISRGSERVAFLGTALALLAELSADEVKSSLPQLTQAANKYRIPRKPLSVRDGFRIIEDRSYAAIVSDADGLNEAFEVSRAESESESYTEREYWDHWAARLRERPSTTDAILALNDPAFGSTQTFESGTSARVTRILTESSLEPAGGWNGVAARFTDLYERAFLSEAVLTEFVLNIRTEESAREIIGALGDEFEVSRGIASLDALVRCKQHDLPGALSALVDIYKHLVDAPLEVRRLQGFGRRISFPLSVALMGHISTGDLLEALEACDGSWDAGAFVTDLLPSLSPFTIPELSTLAIRVAQCDSTPEKEMWVMRRGLEGVISIAPADVASWLCAAVVPIEAVGSFRWDLESWAGLAARAMPHLPGPAGEALRDNALRRLSELGTQVEFRSVAALVVMFAPVDMVEAKQFAEDVLSPFMIGPTWCRIAGDRSREWTEWLALFREGLAQIGPDGTGEFGNLTFMAGQGLGLSGEDGIRKAFHSDVLEKWPAGFIGSAYGVAGVVDSNPSLFSPADLLDMLAVLRSGVRRSRELLGGDADLEAEIEA